MGSAVGLLREMGCSLPQTMIRYYNLVGALI